MDAYCSELDSLCKKREPTARRAGESSADGEMAPSLIPPTMRMRRKRAKAELLRLVLRARGYKLPKMRVLDVVQEGDGSITSTRVACRVLQVSA